jgi:hypothetical protein
VQIISMGYFGEELSRGKMIINSAKDLFILLEAKFDVKAL